MPLGGQEQQRDESVNRDSHLPPLPRRVVPCGWEDLSSLLSRASRRMGYEQPSLLLQSENPAHYVRMADLPVLKRSQDYRFFQQLLLLDEEAIYRMTLHRFASRLSRSAPFSFEFESALSHPYSSGESVPLRWLDGWSYRTLFYANAYTQTCPECLELLSEKTLFSSPQQC
jgi:hypothetical protein